MNIFEKKCETCDGFVLGPREGGKAFGRWLGHYCCRKCRATDQSELQKEKANG